MFRLAMIACLAVMLFSGYKLFTIIREYRRGTQAYHDIAKMAGATPIQQEGEPTRLSIDWDKLNEQGTGVKGWIRLRDTNINYPIVQGPDNDYYLRRIYTGEYNFKGSIFIDYRIGHPFETFNTIVYGHRMNDNSMFDLLGKYFTEADYLSKHPVIEIYTPEKSYDMMIFGALSVNALDSQIYRCDWESAGDEEKQALLDRIRENNELLSYDGSIDVTTADSLVMLSTCTYTPGDDRIVVFGKLVEVGA